MMYKAKSAPKRGNNCRKRIITHGEIKMVNIVNVKIIMLASIIIVLLEKKALTRAAGFGITHFATYLTS
ncbi:hypothetical protein S079_15605 [Salmonella enterica subsp. enterica]|nr:hypothetical protein [Salmonella enterica subsp. enterica]